MDALRKYDALLVFLLALAICTSFIGAYPIYILDEARNSEAAREMFVTGDIIVPYFNGQLRTDKPPLHYFFMMLGYKLFGVNAFGARFFSGVFGALTIWFTYRNVKQWQNKTLAVMTVVILASSLFFVQEFHLAVPDPYLIFFFTLSLFSFYNHYKMGSVGWLVPFYGGMALGVLSKGPIALILPGLIISCFLWFRSDFNRNTILKLRPLLGLGLFFLISAPWFYLVHTATDGEWTKGFFLDHNLSRFGSEKEGHGGLFILTPLFVVLGMLPFSVFIIQGFQWAWKVRKKNDFMLFSFLVSAITILFFSVSSTKLPNYPMPCYPFIGVMIAFYLYQLYHSRTKPKSVLWSLVFLSVVGIVLPIGGYVALGVEQQFLEVRSVSLLLLITTAAGFLALYFYRKDALAKAFWSMAGGWMVMGLCLFGVIYPILTQKSPVSLALERIPEESTIVAFKRFDSAFPINFKQTFPVFDTVDELNTYLEKYPKTYVITNTRNQEDLDALEQFHLVQEQKALFENHVTRIYTK